MIGAHNQIIIRVDCSLYKFLPEINYTLDVIGGWLGFKFQIAGNEFVGPVDIDYGAQPKDGTIWIRETFFSYLCCSGKDGLTLVPDWQELNRFIPETQNFMGIDFVPLFGTDTLGSSVRTPSESGTNWAILHDLIGAVFFMLSRIEELVKDGRDHYGRFCAQHTLAYRGGFLERPETDRQVELLSRVLLACGKVGFTTGSMKVYLTHDVDRLRAYHGLATLARESLGNVIRRRSAPLAVVAQVFRKLCAGEPFRSARWLMDRAEERGVECRFFFMAGTRHPVDADYAYRWRKQMLRIAKEIQSRGHILGFHPGFETWRDEGAWLRQKAALENILGNQVLEGRQHVLRFHPYTWEIWEKAGMKRDYGLSFLTGVTYRAGTTRSYRVYGLRVRRPFHLEVVPTSVMEFALFMNKYVDIPLQDAMQRVKAAVAEHRYYRGDLAVLFHPVTVMNLQHEYSEVLSEIFDQHEHRDTKRS